MYLNVGNDILIRVERIIGIFDLDSASTAPDTKDILKKAEQNGTLVQAGYELPKSFLLTVDGKIHLSQFSSKVLKIKAQRLLV